MYCYQTFFFFLQLFFIVFFIAEVVKLQLSALPWQKKKTLCNSNNKSLKQN